MVFVWKSIRKKSFLTIPPHSQLIHNHDAEVYVRSHSVLFYCHCWYIFFGTSFHGFRNPFPFSDSRFLVLVLLD